MKNVRFLVIIFIVLFMVIVSGIYYKTKISKDIELAPQKTCSCPYKGYEETGVVEHLKGDKNTMVTKVLVNDCSGSICTGSCIVEYSAIIQSEEDYVVEGFTTAVPCS